MFWFVYLYSTQLGGSSLITPLRNDFFILRQRHGQPRVLGAVFQDGERVLRHQHRLRRLLVGSVPCARVGCDGALAQRQFSTASQVKTKGEPCTLYSKGRILGYKR